MWWIGIKPRSIAISSVNSQDRCMLPAGSLKPNDWGFFDVLGNAMEWTQDEARFYLSSAQGDPKKLIKEKQKVSKIVKCVCCAAARSPIEQWTSGPRFVVATSRRSGTTVWVFVRRGLLRLERNKSGGNAPHSIAAPNLECGAFPPLLFPVFF
jgi:hypothetical protein